MHSRQIAILAAAAMSVAGLVGCQQESYDTSPTRTQSGTYDNSRPAGERSRPDDTSSQSQPDTGVDHEPGLEGRIDGDFGGQKKEPGGVVGEQDTSDAGTPPDHTDVDADEADAANPTDNTGVTDYDPPRAETEADTDAGAVPAGEAETGAEEGADDAADDSQIKVRGEVQPPSALEDVDAEIDIDAASDDAASDDAAGAESETE